MLSFLELSQEILKYMRGKRSASQMDHHLDLGSGQYLRWESGLVQIKWDDFVLISKKLKLPLSKALHECLLYDGNLFHFDSIIEACVGTTSQETLGKQLEVTRYTVNRWMNRKTPPTLIQMLKILHFGTTKLPLFMEVFVEGQVLPSFKAYMSLIDDNLELLQKMPWISGILCSLSLNGYKELSVHEDLWLARKLGLSEDVIKSSIDALANYDLIRWNGKHYESTLNEVNPSVLKAKARDLLMYWMNKNLEAVAHCYPSPERKSLSSYHIFAVDKETSESIKKLYVDFTKELSILVNQGMEKPENMYAFTLSMIDFDEYQKTLK